MVVIELLLDIRMAANDIRRQIKKCETEESAQLTRLRQSTRDGRTQISTVLAENVIRQRIELVRLEAMLGPLVALSARLKQAIMNAAVSVGMGETDSNVLADRQLADGLLQQAKLPSTAHTDPVSSSEVYDLIARLSETDEQGLASLASMQQDELMDRLRSLRK